MATSWNFKNFSKATISGSHNTVVTTINVVTGHGTRFGTSFPMMAAVWRSSAFPDPADAFHDSPSKAELVEITARTTDALTVVRAKESTSGLDMTDTSQTFSIMGVHTAVQVAAGDGSVENVRAHGAIGDGVVDDTTAVIAAIDAAVAGGTVYFPPGTYELTTWPAAGKNPAKKLRFLGTDYSVVKGPVTTDFLDCRDDLTMDRMSFEDWDSVVKCEGLTGTIDKIHITDCFSDGHFNFFNWGAPVDASVIDSITITGCKLINAAHFHIFVAGSGTSVGQFNQCIISNNTITGGRRGIHVGNNVGSGKTQTTWKRILINGNSVSGQTSAVTDTAGIILYGENVVVSDNHVSDVTGGNTEHWGIYTKARNTTITGNTITDVHDGLGTTTGRAISIKGAHRAFLPQDSTYSYMDSVSNNAVKSSSGAIRIESDQCVVNGNVFEDIEKNLIVTIGLDRVTEDLVISNNVAYHDPALNYLHYTAIASGPWTLNETVTGDSSSATAVIVGGGGALAADGILFVNAVSGTFTSSEGLTGGTSGTTGTFTKLAVAGEFMRYQNPCNRSVVSGNSVFGNSVGVRFDPTNASSGPAMVNDQGNYAITGNIFDCTGLGVSVQTSDPDLTSSLIFENLLISGNIFRDCPNGAWRVTPDNVMILKNFRITGNVYDDAMDKNRDHGYGRLEGEPVTGLAIDDIEGNFVRHWNGIQIINGEWDGEHLMIGDGANAFHVWQDGTNLRGLKGAPTAAGDGTVIV